jgi:hypothetical protein
MDPDEEVELLNEAQMNIPERAARVRAKGIPEIKAVKRRGAGLSHIHKVCSLTPPMEWKLNREKGETESVGLLALHS